MKIFRHAGMRVLDLDRAVEIWGRLGFVPTSIEDEAGWGQKLRIAKLAATDQSGVIELVQTWERWPSHVAVSVRDAVEAAKGFKRWRKNGKARYVVDPWGNNIELVEESE